MWKEIKCPKCNGTGKIIKQISTIINYSYSTGTAKEICCPICNGFKILKQKCFGTEKNKIEKKRTKCSRFELMDI